MPREHVPGMEASQGTIDGALLKSRPNLRFLRMDIDQLDFADWFEVVVPNVTSHWMRRHGRLLGDVRRALRPGAAADICWGAASVSHAAGRGLPPRRLRAQAEGCWFVALPPHKRVRREVDKMAGRMRKG
jgi:SAM-dependent methyltransferase